MNKRKIISLGAQLTKLSYLPQTDETLSKIQKVCPELREIRFFDIAESDVQGFTCFFVTGDQVANWLVVIRGTEFTNIADWKTNLDCSHYETRNGWVHNGFRQDAISLFQYLKNVALDSRMEYIFGHSQGAAVAKQLGLIFFEENEYIPLTVGYGEPRSMSKEYSDKMEKYSSSFIRVVHNNDIVTRIPPRAMGFSHLGSLCYFNEWGEFENSSNVWTRFLDRIKGHLGDFGEPGLDCLKDHPPEIYADLCKNFA